MRFGLARIMCLVAVLAELLVLDHAGTQAGTYSVGAGPQFDYSSIHAAVDAAASGDTVAVYAGRYTETRPFEIGATEDAFVGVRTSNLTMIAMVPDSVVVGPSQPSVDGFGPWGLAVASNVEGLRFEGFVIENVRDGVHMAGSGSLASVTIRDCSIGLALLSSSQFEGTQLSIVRSNLVGLASTGDVGEILLEDCIIVDNLVGLDLNQTDLAVLTGCSVLGGGTGVGAAQGTFVRLLDSIVTGQTNSSVIALTSSTVEMQRCTVGSSGQAVFLSQSQLFGSGNRVRAGSFATLRFASGATALFRGNDLEKGEGYLVRTEGYLVEPTINIDLTGNYWGTTEADSISAWILDGNDHHHPVLDPNYSNVLFDPFLTESVPVKRSSFGGLKGGY